MTGYEHQAAAQPDAERVQGEVTAAVERLAKALALLEPDEPWPTNAELGGSLTGTRDDEFRDGKRDEARELLDAALDGGYLADDIADHTRDVTRPDEIACTCGSAFDLHSELYMHQAEALRAAILGGAA